MVLKTRDRFIEVARQLFARKGVENTTMNDIASASDKGRRTIYTYFKSKREIFNAVVESETGQLLARLRSILARPISPEEKIREYIEFRFEALQEIVNRNGSQRASFFRDARKVDRVRKIISRHEVVMFRELLDEGVRNGDFDVADTEIMAIVITQAIYGLDLPFIRDNHSDRNISTDVFVKTLSHTILHGILKER